MKKPKYNTEHGSPYDRGSADAYYGRKKDPHWWPKGTYFGERIGINSMTPLQIEEYHNGYDQSQRVLAIKKGDNSMKEINPAFIQAAKAYDFTIEYCEETNKTIIKSKDRNDSFWWDSSEDDSVFWSDLKTYFYEKGYNVSSSW